MVSSRLRMLQEDRSIRAMSPLAGHTLFYYGDEQGLCSYGTALDGWSREDFMTSLAWDMSVGRRPNPAEGQF